ncbi:hypothetical protein LCGC14_3131730, partial [marine sediment metagenome]
ETDARLEIWAADAASAWGLRPSLLILDELSQWRGHESEELFNAAFSSTGKVPGCQLLVGTTAGWDRNSLCYRIRGLAMDSDDWYYSDRPQCASWIDAEFLRRQKEILPFHVYEMLHENRWTEAGGEWLSWDEIDGVFDEALSEQSSRGGPSVEGQRSRYYIGVDLATSRDRTAVGVVRAEGEDLTVESITTWQGSPKERVQLGEVEEAIVALSKAFHPKEIVLDPFQALLMGERLRGTGLTVFDYTFTSVSRASLFDTLLQLIRQERLHSYDHPLFREELSGMRWVEKNGILRPDHRTSKHDDTVVAVALASTRAVAGAVVPRSLIKVRHIGDRSTGSR